MVKGSGGVPEAWGRTGDDSSKGGVRGSRRRIALTSVMEVGSSCQERGGRDGHISRATQRKRRVRMKRGHKLRMVLRQ